MDDFVQFFTANTTSAEKSSSKSTHVARPGRQSSRLTHRPWDVNGASGAFSAGTFSTMTSPHPFMPRVFGDYAPGLSYPPGELAESGQCDVEVVNGSVDATSGPRHRHVGQPYRSCDDILEKAGVQRCRTAKHFGVAVPW